MTLAGHEVGGLRLPLVEAPEAPEDVAEVVERSTELEDDARALAALDRTLEILDTARVARRDVRGIRAQGVAVEGDRVAAQPGEQGRVRLRDLQVRPVRLR